MPRGIMETTAICSNLCHTVDVLRKCNVMYETFSIQLYVISQGNYSRAVILYQALKISIFAQRLRFSNYFMNIL